METMSRCPIFILSFINRAKYLQKMLESLMSQTDATTLERPILFFQDGASNPVSQEIYAKQAELDSCQAVFQQLVPNGKVVASNVNIGIALNYDRAERYAFQTLKSEAAIFLMDNLSVSRCYLAIMGHLLTVSAQDRRVGYVAANGDDALSKEEQLQKQDRLMTMKNNSGYGLYKRQWERMRPHVDEYLALISNVDYRQRDHDSILKLFTNWGFGTQDTTLHAATTLACCLTRTVRIDTNACFARTISEVGNDLHEVNREHSHFATTPELHDMFREIEPLTDNLYYQFRADLLHWADQVKSTPKLRCSDPDTVALELFHSVNSLAGTGDINEAVNVATKAVEAIFFSRTHDCDFVSYFYPLTAIRDIPNESHIRFDIRGNSLRVLCPQEMVSPHFTNYFYAFAIASRIIEVVLRDSVQDGGFTMDLANDSQTGSYKRVSFSSALSTAELILDPEFYQSNGYADLRISFKRNWKDWKERTEMAYWRGKSTGIQSQPDRREDSSESLTDWDWLQRLKLCSSARQSRYTRKLNVGLSHIVQISSKYIVETISENNFLLNPESESEYTNYQYIIVLDGNTSMGNGLLQAMLAGSCVFLVDSRFGFRSWFYDRLIPGETHITLDSQLLDLDEKLEWAFSHPEECARIAKNGHMLATGMSLESELQLSIRRVKNAILP